MQEVHGIFFDFKEILLSLLLCLSPALSFRVTNYLQDICSICSLYIFSIKLFSMSDCQCTSQLLSICCCKVCQGLLLLLLDGEKKKKKTKTSNSSSPWTSMNKTIFIILWTYTDKGIRKWYPDLNKKTRTYLWSCSSEIQISPNTRWSYQWWIVSHYVQCSLWALVRDQIGDKQR